MPSLELVEVVEEPEHEGVPQQSLPETSTLDVVATASDDEEVQQQDVVSPSSSSPTTSAPVEKSSKKGAGSKRNEVTPVNTDNDTKKLQQKKVSQMTMSLFLSKDAKTSSPSSSAKKPVFQSRIHQELLLRRKQKKEAAAKQKTKAKTPAAKAKSSTKAKSPALTKTVASKKKSNKKEQSSDASDCTGGSPLQDQVLEEVPASNDDKKDSSSDDIAAGEAVPMEVDEPASKQENETAAPPSKTKVAAAVSPTPATTSTAPKKVEEPLSEERVELLDKHDKMKVMYEGRSETLVKEAKQVGWLSEEQEMNSTPPVFQKTTEGNSESQDFSDAALANMALLVEGSPLSLSKLTEKVGETLKSCHQKEWTAESISNKLKLFATRKAMLSATTTRTNIFEDEDKDRLWRWELAAVELLPADVLVKARKARSVRRKLSSHYNAIHRLIKSINDAEKVIRDMKRKSLETALAKISRDEEKVLKYEREAEKLQLALAAKRKKVEEAEERKREKERQMEQKRKEKERKKEELEQLKLEKEKERLQKKQDVQHAKEEAKRKKQQKETEKKLAEDQKKVGINKQKGLMMSFFGGKSSTSAASKNAPSLADTTAAVEVHQPQPIAASSGSFDVDKFRSQIGTGDVPLMSVKPPFQSLSARAKRSRKRRTQHVTVSVYVTVVSEDDGWGAQPFAETRDISIPNKYRLLRFQEDCRPAYHGTWTKTSSIVTGRNPFGKDTSFLDYDCDSEAEWEEGDDEVGEDVEDEAKNQEEEDDGDAIMYDYDDGFCVADDQYLDADDNVDEETKALYKKKLEVDEGAVSNRVCVIAPALGGLPLCSPAEAKAGQVEGFSEKELASQVSSHRSTKLSEARLWLDAFPPTLIDEPGANAADGSAAPQSGEASSSSKDEYTNDDLQVLAKFVNHSLLNSKEKIIEELRNANPKKFENRAKATRKLDSIADKIKHPCSTGYYWQVKKQFLQECGLHELVDKKLEGLEEALAARKKQELKKKRELAKKNKAAAAKKQGDGKSPTKGAEKTKKDNPTKVGNKGASSKAAPKATKEAEKKRKTSPNAAWKDGQSKKKIKAIPVSSLVAATNKPSPGSVNVLSNFLIKQKKAKTESPVESTN